MIESAQILTVTQLNRQIRVFLEHEVGEVCVEGEISTISKPSSGHFYFTLKDASAQIRCVFFRSRKNEDTDNILQTGQQVIATGQLSLYEARGDYQLIVNTLEAAGQGDLYRQFEQLKEKLRARGLFEQERKKTIPLFPQIIGIITSSSGAALHDILTTLARRYPLAQVLIYPSDVQGKQAVFQLMMAIQQANQDMRANVLILARGGGSIEDLWPFNDEQLAYAIAESQIPIVCGVGHETDFTIADFVADLRAATPTAAAEAVSPNQIELTALFHSLQHRLQNAIQRFLIQKQLHLRHQSQKLSSPQQLIQSYWQTLDYRMNQLNQAMQQQIRYSQHQFQMLLTRFNASSPLQLFQQKQNRTQSLSRQLVSFIQTIYQQYHAKLQMLLGKLDIVSPLATLERGYAIVMYGDNVLLRSKDVNIGNAVNIQLGQGKLICEVQHVEFE